MQRFKKRHLFWIIPLPFLVIIIVLNFFQFRDSDKVITERLAKKNLKPTFHDYVNGNQTIHYWDISYPEKPLVMFVHGSPGSSRELMGIATDSLIIANFMPLLVDRP